MRGRKFTVAAAMVVMAASMGVRVMADEASDFKDAFVKLLDSSKDGFKGVLADNPKDAEGGDKIYKSKVALPGVRHADIWVYADKNLTPSYRADLLTEGQDKAEGDKIYKGMVANIKNSIPAEWKTEEYTIADRDMEGMEFMAYPPDESRSVTLSIKTDRKSKDIDVELIIDAKEKK